MCVIYSSDKEPGIGLCNIKCENGFRNLPLGDKRLEDRGTLKVRDGLVCHTQNTICGHIEIVAFRGRAKCLPSSLICGIVSCPLSVSTQKKYPANRVPSQGDGVRVLLNKDRDLTLAITICKGYRVPNKLRGRTLRGIVLRVSLTARARNVK